MMGSELSSKTSSLYGSVKNKETEVIRGSGYWLPPSLWQLPSFLVGVILDPLII